MWKMICIIKETNKTKTQEEIGNDVAGGVVIAMLVWSGEGSSGRCFCKEAGFELTMCLR